MIALLSKKNNSVIRNILFCSWIFLLYYSIAHLCIFVYFLQEIVFCYFMIPENGNKFLK
ncbi:hypothetical protein LEP1GSC062_1252 [Leptospira alexanderi serovar Manhao 3 str. L 60]|uniref:Uncharacterized protein n=1 Tax=Leptospira alexanderi serovar Manhao 3 str. L 60 TaxID=1049759 RepID=V6IB93_9LEPT|nr:hypothetical protein LEP1GSC062_1252 [Leptospira alexanderi serovar Manhao 3 str. L 60]